MGRRRRRGGPYGLGDDDGGRLSPQAVAYRAQLAALEADPRLRGAARVAATFHLDPVLLLSEPDPFRRLERIAAHNVVMADEAKANRKTSS